jgi:hypothetical protein
LQGVVMLRSMASGLDISQSWARTSARRFKSVRFIADDITTLRHRSVLSAGIVS